MGNSKLRNLYLIGRLAFVTAPEGGDGGAGGGGAGGGAPTGDGQGADKGGSSGGYTPPASQEDLDRIVAARLSRERARYADYDDLKAKASKLDEIEQASATDLEKAVKKARDEATAEATAATRQVLVQAEARALAAAARFRNPGDAIALLAAEKKLDDIKVDGAVVDQAAVKAAVEQLAKDRPYLLDTGGTPGVVPGAGSKDSGTAKPKNLTDAISAHYTR